MTAPIKLPLVFVSSCPNSPNPSLKWPNCHLAIICSANRALIGSTDLHGLGQVALQLWVRVLRLGDPLLERGVAVGPRAPHVVGALRDQVVHVAAQTLARGTRSYRGGKKYQCTRTCIRGTVRYCYIVAFLSTHFNSRYIIAHKQKKNVCAKSEKIIYCTVSWYCTVRTIRMFAYIKYSQVNILVYCIWVTNLTELTPTPFC